jgi:septal ring factor EnvC (AmiA/AmiB activator)
MNDERADLILSLLRSIRSEQATQREKLDEIIGRIGALEREVASLHLRIAEIKVDFASLSARLDNLDRRVARIEQRLEIVDAPMR